MTIPLSRAELYDLDPAAPTEAPGQRIFPRPSKLLHWLTASLVLVMFCTGVLMKQIGDGPLANDLYTFHKVAGASLLGLVLVRLSYRCLAHLRGRWLKGAGSHPVHGVLYAGLILVPLLGWAGISDYGARGVYFGLSLPAIWPEGAGFADLLFKSHAWLAFTLIGLVAVHIGIALGDYIQRGTNRGARTENAFPARADMP